MTEQTAPREHTKAPKMTPEEQARWNEHVRALWTIGNNNTPKGK